MIKTLCRDISNFKALLEEKIFNCLFERILKWIFKKSAASCKDRNNVVFLLSKINYIQKCCESVIRICYINNRSYSLFDIEQNEILPNAIAIEHPENFPQSLYRYRPNTKKEDSNGESKNYSIDDLCSNKVFVQNASKFNDPYDSYALTYFDSYAIIILQYYLSETNTLFSKDEDTTDLIYKLAALLNGHFKACEQNTKLIPRLTESMSLLFGLNETNKKEKTKSWSFVTSLQIYICNNWLKLHENDFFIDAIRKLLFEEFLKEKTQFSWGIACFSTSFNSILMWSHYADSHKGFCIEYDFTNIKEYGYLYGNVHPIIYCDHISNVNDVISNTNNRLSENLTHSIIKKWWLRKSTNWKYENEWRMIIPSSSDKSINRYDFFPIKKVYLGYKMLKPEKKEIIAICKTKGIEYCCMRIKPEKYEMEICDRLCEECPSLK